MKVTSERFIHKIIPARREMFSCVQIKSTQETDLEEKEAVNLNIFTATTQTETRLCDAVTNNEKCSKTLLESELN